MSYIPNPYVLKEKGLLCEPASLILLMGEKRHP